MISFKLVQLLKAVPEIRSIVEGNSIVSKALQSVKFGKTLTPSGMITVFNLSQFETSGRDHFSILSFLDTSSPLYSFKFFLDNISEVENQDEMISEMLTFITDWLKNHILEF